MIDATFFSQASGFLAASKRVGSASFVRKHLQASFIRALYHGIERSGMRLGSILGSRIWEQYKYSVAYYLVFMMSKLRSLPRNSEVLLDDAA
jgi:hypothetical protein